MIHDHRPIQELYLSVVALELDNLREILKYASQRDPCQRNTDAKQGQLLVGVDKVLQLCHLIHKVRSLRWIQSQEQQRQQHYQEHKGHDKNLNNRHLTSRLSRFFA